MARTPKRPLLNPVLQLRLDPRPEAQTGGGKGRDSVKTERLGRQQQLLAAAATQIFESRANVPAYAGRAQLVVRMFADSLAPSHTPDDLFSLLHGCQLVAPFRNGYVVETELAQLPRLIRAIRNPGSFAVQSDISRVARVNVFSPQERLRHHTVDQLWLAAPEEDRGRLFNVWLSPYRNRDAQEALLQKVERFHQDGALLPTFTAIRLLPRGRDGGADVVAGATGQRQSSIARAMRTYRNTGVARATVAIPSRQALTELVASGASYRIDPVQPITVAAPGSGSEPAPALDVGDAPIVGVVDGGLHAASYAAAEAWKAPPLISDAQADRRHGNAISSLVVQGHAWNKNRTLPELNCRIGTVQAVPNASANMQFDEQQLIDYLAAVVRAHPETKVWNISANQRGMLDPEEVSVLGHELNALARSAGVLPVVSIGNVVKGKPGRLNPPADCEAALVVGGRQASTKGLPAKACPSCLQGPGPDGMLKPDMSWFSQLRVIGGGISTGSSYPTALVSSLAAHTYEQLRDPTPDLVKALLINTCERNEHDPRLGWGTPYQGALPWNCAPGTVTLVWTAQLRPGANYYWNNIPIPPELIADDKLFGRASLTAVLNPLVSPYGGANYFASRLQTSLRYCSNKKWVPLVGTMLESTLEEADARSDLLKWQPIRRHTKDFTQRGGLAFDGSSLQLYARIFARDLYQFGWNHHSEAPPQEVAFVLTLQSSKNDAGIYNSMAQQLGTFVESAVIDQEIEIDE